MRALVATAAIFPWGDNPGSVVPDPRGWSDSAPSGKAQGNTTGEQCAPMWTHAVDAAKERTPIEWGLSG